MRILLGILILLAGISSCQPSPDQPTANGIWESIGSGWILHIRDSTRYQFYDLTSISCLPGRTGEFEEIAGSLVLSEDTLRLRKGVITYSFTRRGELAGVCTLPVDSNQIMDPLYNFEVFAETVNEHYAFFELNEINWERLYQEQKAKLNPGSTDVELYRVIEETLEKLNDNHAYLEATDEVYDALEGQEEEEDADLEELPEYGDFQVAQMVAEHHMQEELTRDSWLIQWGKLTDDVGFIQVKSMWLYADLEIPEKLIEELGYVDAYVETFHQIYEGDYIDREVAGVSRIMDDVMNDLSSMRAIVIDVRFNGGGQDAVSFEILSRFITQPELQIATQKLRVGDGFSPTLPLFIKGNGEAFAGPVYVLTSPQTGSAAEAFSIATLAMDHVRRIGSPTSGAMSTALEKTLPNGWEFAISNEVYMDNQGKNYENTGIPVDVELNYSRDRQTFFRSVVDDLEKDKQDILNAVK